MCIQLLVNRMRLRFRLNEQRVAEMLRGINPESLGANFLSVTAGLLGCIGDIASLNFMPVFAGALRPNPSSGAQVAPPRLDVPQLHGPLFRATSRP